MWGVAEYEFLVQAVGDIGNVELFFFRAYFRVEKHMKQHVAEFFAYVGVIVVEKRLCQFVSFLDGVGAQRLVSLLGVPGALHAQDVECVDDAAKCFYLFFTGVILVHVYLLYSVLPSLSHLTKAATFSS